MKNFYFTLIFMVGVIQSSLSQETIAHRGAHKNNDLPENSIASLEAAGKQYLWGTEFDVHMTKDNMLVINHDIDFYGKDIPSSIYKLLSAKRHPNGESIPTLKRYLKTGQTYGNLKMILEIKENPDEERTLKATREIYEMVNKLGSQDQVEYISFSYPACQELRKLDNDISIHYLEGDKAPQELKQDGLSGLDYHFDVYKQHPEWIKQAKDLGLKTNVWTVNDEENIRYFIDQDIDYITTDDPRLVQRLIEQSKSGK